MNCEFFDLNVETQLATTLLKGDILRRENDPRDHFLILLILESVSTHKSPKAAIPLKHISTWFMFLAPYFRDLNPIGMAYAKLKTPIRKTSAIVSDQFWKYSITSATMP